MLFAKIPRLFYIYCAILYIFIMLIYVGTVIDDSVWPRATIEFETILELGYDS